MVASSPFSWTREVRAFLTAGSPSPYRPADCAEWCLGPAIPAALKARGWSDARAFSSTQLQKNPNSYFYRHVEPEEVQVGLKGCFSR